MNYTIFVLFWSVFDVIELCLDLTNVLFFLFYSTYITGGGGGGLGNPALSSIDEAYHFYGMKNPLEPETSGGRLRKYSGL